MSIPADQGLAAIVTGETSAIPVGVGDVPLVCPRPAEPLWTRHPRVFLDVLTDGHAVCPYCGARYVFIGERPVGHH
jgi:uncharacterized Zn-finger protein